MAHSELLNCPFCGGEPYPAADTSYGYWSVVCQSEECPVKPQAEGDTEAEAIAAWNQRAPGSRITQLEAALALRERVLAERLRELSRFPSGAPRISDKLARKIARAALSQSKDTAGG